MNDGGVGWLISPNLKCVNVNAGWYKRVGTPTKMPLQTKA
jgi:hypothetical protein